MVLRLNEICGLEVFTEEGKHVGIMDDLSVDPETGKVLGVVISKLDPKFSEHVGAEGKKGVIAPYSTMKSIGDIAIMRPISFTGADK